MCVSLAATVDGRDVISQAITEYGVDQGKKMSPGVCVHVVGIEGDSFRTNTWFTGTMVSKGHFFMIHCI